MMPAITNRLRDARAACLEIETFTDGRSIDDLWNDRGFQIIIHKLLEIVGEALSQARKIDPAVVDAISDAHRHIAVRHQITHGYESVDYSILWTIATERVPTLVESLDKALVLLDPPSPKQEDDG